MKLAEYSGLWSAIQQFPLDDPNAEITFSRKLSAKQNWSPTFTERVVEEYRKFIFLCCISPNGASPSQAVDEAWHLHLTYTKSYWNDLCKNTLGKDLHHHPSRGGEDEDHKHLDWYKDTLILYQSVFESPPPDDIWPPPVEPEIPEPAWDIRSEIKALIVLLLVVPLIVIAYLYRTFSPYSLDGPQFLVFFPLLAITGIVCYVIVQHERCRQLKQLVADHFPSNASVFQTVQFLYGKHRAVQTAIVDLMRRNLLGLTSDKKFIIHKNWYSKPANEQNPLIDGFLNESDTTVSYEMIVGNWYNEEAFRHPVLQQLYLLAWREESIIKKYHMLLLPLMVGITRIFQGLANGNPGAYLFLEMVFFVIVSCAVEQWQSRKSIVFTTADELAKQLNANSSWYSDHVVSEFAIHGDSAIQWFSDGLVLATIFSPYPVLVHAGATRSQTSNSCSSCSGGGGCSGGGDGGGGCGGGCGGCGGGD